MRYAQYHKRIVRLDKKIAGCLTREERAIDHGGPWYYRLFPSLRTKTVEMARSKRSQLSRERAVLEREMFGASLIWNPDVSAVFRRTVPGSSEAVNQLRASADAALDFKG